MSKTAFGFKTGNEVNTLPCLGNKGKKMFVVSISFVMILYFFYIYNFWMKHFVSVSSRNLKSVTPYLVTRKVIKQRTSQINIKKIDCQGEWRLTYLTIVIHFSFCTSCDRTTFAITIITTIIKIITIITTITIITITTVIIITTTTELCFNSCNSKHIISNVISLSLLILIYLSLLSLSLIISCQTFPITHYCFLIFIFVHNSLKFRV